jgi:hypothetical protein
LLEYNILKKLFIAECMAVVPELYHFTNALFLKESIFEHSSKAHFSFKTFPLYRHPLELNHSHATQPLYGVSQLISLS